MSTQKTTFTNFFLHLGPWPGVLDPVRSFWRGKFSDGGPHKLYDAHIWSADCMQAELTGSATADCAHVHVHYVCGTWQTCVQTLGSVTLNWKLYNLLSGERVRVVCICI